MLVGNERIRWELMWQLASVAMLALISHLNNTSCVTLVNLSITLLIL